MRYYLVLLGVALFFIVFLVTPPTQRRTHNICTCQGDSCIHDLLSILIDPALSIIHWEAYIKHSWLQKETQNLAVCDVNGILCNQYSVSS
jgi:hypothetical protein